MAKKAFGFTIAVVTGAFVVSPAAAQELDASASVSASTSDGVSADIEGGNERSTVHNLEFGLFAGALFPAKDHNFENRATELTPGRHRRFKYPVIELGLRLGYYPIQFAGLEVEGMLGLGETSDGESATLGAFRGHVIGQVPLGPVVPFGLVGFGIMGADTKAMGSDADPAWHFGVGAKFPLSRALDLRIDGRDTITQRNNASDGGQTNHLAVLLGLTYVLGLAPEEPPPPLDTDSDGFLDPSDRCPTVPGVAPDGCPPPDTDKDGFVDPDDKCPTEPGIAPDGCPDRDPDKDGFLDPDDKCPTEAGVAPDGCPDKDPDKDGILDPVDKCPTEPETRNGYEDQDGCPDEVPEEVQKFTGVIQGIEFDFGKANIRKTSHKTLDAAVKVMQDYPSIRIEIAGHTDSVGTRERNLELSQMRADAVRDYMVEKGIEASRIHTRGAGPDEPIADNKTNAGRQKNRRIEFRLLQD